MSFFERKTLRYYYWLVKEFIKKHSKMMLLSFFLSFFIVIALDIVKYLLLCFRSRLKTSPVYQLDF